VQRRPFRDQDPVNIEASELIARLHDALKASGYDGHDLELFLVRAVFCLFADADRIRIPDFDTDMRRVLLDAGQFDWTAISPAIFGALFQSVMEPVERRAQGAHYTTEKNILKVIEPLFMDDLRAEFERVRSRRDQARLAALRGFQAKLGRMRFFDPACG